MTERYFIPRNWEKHQGYSKRGPRWIKNHVALLRERRYRKLTEAQRAVLHGLWLLYASVGEPLAWDCGDIGEQLGIRPQTVGKALEVLRLKDFIELAAESVAEPATNSDKLGSLETEVEKEANTSLRSVSDADGVVVLPPKRDPPDLKTEIWGPCLTWLAEHTSKPMGKLRPVVGRWCRDFGEGRTLELMQQMAREAPIDPIAWMESRNERTRKSSPTAAAIAGILDTGTG